MIKKIALRLSTETKSVLFNKAFDLVIVILGVSIAFQLNNLKQESDQKSLEHFYIESLLADISKDINKMYEIVSSLRSDKEKASACLVTGTDGFINADVLESSLIEILSFETFNDRNENTYNTLVTSNGISVIRNRNLRSMIADYYKSYGSIDRFESVYTELLINHFHSYFAPYYDYSTQKLVDKSIVKQVKTRNTILLAREQLNDGIEDYEEAINKAKSLKEMLQSELADN